MGFENDDVFVSSNVKLEQLLCMKGGQDEMSSYARNSQAQAQHARSVHHHLEEALDRLQLPSPDISFAVVDLGCASSTNAIFNINSIIEHIKKRYKLSSDHSETPEFLAFFSDLPSNDFNTLFQLLPPKNSSSSSSLASDGHHSYFVAGVPGSFHGRLFPRKSVNVFYSSFALHWLSQVPVPVTDRTTPAYNKGRVFVNGANAATAEAYKRQFQSDMSSFLRSRSQELKEGGSMFLVFLGRTSTSPTDQGGPGILFGTHFQDAWNDLVQEGLISEEMRDGFNIPVYAASLEDFEEAVEAEGSFTIQKLQLVKGGSPLIVSHEENAAEVGQALVNSCRSVAGVLVEARIGKSLSDELFKRMESRGSKHARELLEDLQFHHIVASLSLTHDTN